MTTNDAVERRRIRNKGIAFLMMGMALKVVMDTSTLSALGLATGLVVSGIYVIVKNW
jgi:hypothetical protein